jgi:hypothetical protein
VRRARECQALVFSVTRASHLPIFPFFHFSILPLLPILSVFLCYHDTQQPADGSLAFAGDAVFALLLVLQYVLALQTTG